MTEREICLMYRGAKNQDLQLQILAELNGVSRNEIIRILMQNGEKIPSHVIRKLYRRLEALEAQISEKEREYREIAQALNAIGTAQEGKEWHQDSASWTH